MKDFWDGATGFVIWTAAVVVGLAWLYKRWWIACP